MQLDFMFSLEMQLIFGVMFLLLAIGISSLVSGENPYALTVFFVGLVLIILSAGAVMYIENMKSIAMGWVESELMSKKVFDDFKQKSTLFLFVFPFVTAAIGTNLLTEVISRNFKFDQRLTLSKVLLGFWGVVKFILGLAILPITIPLVVVAVILFSVNATSRRWYPSFVSAVGKISRRTELFVLKADIVLRTIFKTKT
ncbi:conserved membrane hypothetical protein [Vibrio chagasii]|uniref:hypothetical protein n=1 Tax=Vibrio chagasii TaxID=170679 RepID=UPI001EFCEAB8|nr:hypothetical protein [Vibrio chagasii]MCG9604768.1 hypothetical protein [Vibrio chagasii]CAH7301349.1 conserved membrane hypothetical protein [Vibrio chagasii]CAH7338591.1 conserved membrane hypothetical protein [Vibrio chagasii]CAH7363339.1 conserved membrane hypothetical protein [Vibrio chagasii]CAH7401901.1 conserved membrane hypothetical protein [Vibrio chagasii]